MSALWKQRTSLDPTFASLNRCLEEDWFMLPYELKLQRAHALALEAAGILTAGEHEALRQALDGIAARFADASCPASDAEDLHTWIEGELTERAGEAGRKIHTARSRNDQVATLLKLFVINAGAALKEDLETFIRIACEKAIRWSDVVMPLLTHQQFATPGSAGFWALRFATSFDRVARRVAFHLHEWRRYCPLGSGALAGSSIPIDRSIQARELGFEAPAPNALDATSTRDECLEFLAIATQVALHLQSLATDVIIFTQTPLAWTKYPPAFATGSSMMPNKTNPDAMELLRGECNSVAAAHAQLVGILKGLPSGYNRDLQCVKPLLHQSASTLHGLTRMAAAFLEGLDFDTDRTAASLRLGNIGATLRMEERVKAGTPLRAAHHAVADELAAGDDPATPQIDAPLRRYATAGSTNPEEVVRVANELLASLGA